MGKAVLFRGKGAVLEAYELNGMSTWAIAAGGQIFTAYCTENMSEGGAALEEALNLLCQGGSEGTFNLQVYPAGTTEVDSKTPVKRGFPFSLYADGISGRDHRMGYSGDILRLREENERLLSALEAKKEEEDQPEGSPVINGLIGMVQPILQHPEMQQMIIAGIGRVAGKIFTMFNTKPASVAGTPQADGISQAHKIDTALDILEKVDPLLGDHLMAIAKIATENPGQYSLLIGMLPK